MSRSVLPSTGRKAARDARRAIQRRQRARDLAVVTEYRRAADPADVTPEVHDPDFRGEISRMVMRRRGSDKVGPLIRWAKARIAADPVLRSAPREEQVAYFARLMPPTLIGRHAVGHIEWALKPPRWHKQYRASQADPGAAAAAKTERQVRLIMAAGRHGTLNAELRRVLDREARARPSRDPMPRRLLLGSYDIEAFAAEASRHATLASVVAKVAAAAAATPPRQPSR